MNPRDTKPPTPDNPTAGGRAIGVDATSSDTDGMYRVHVVPASEPAAGTMELDDRGQPRWKYNDKQATRDPETTFDLLKALENAAIVMDEPGSPIPQPKPDPGYNPYDTGAVKPGRKQ